jgi:DNA-binding CsgD family transcriptional regulator
MIKFSKRELEVLKLQKEGVKGDEIIATHLGIKNPEQIAVHRTNARRKVVQARRFYLNAMKEYGTILFPGASKKYKER